MYRRTFGFLLLCVFAAAAAALPVAVTRGQADKPSAQAITVADTRTGNGPCGFPIRRDIEGVVELAPAIDEAGNLVLAIDAVDLRGRLTNPANGKSVELRWVEQNGLAIFRADGDTTAVTLGLTAHFFRGYDSARTDLGLDLPADGAAMVEFAPGVRSEEPWAHACGLLA